MIARRSFGPELVQFVKEKCVPVAAYLGTNSFTLRTVNGKVLGAPNPGSSSDVNKGYQEFLRLPLAERKPKDVAPVTLWWPPVPPDALVLRVWSRALYWDKGKFHLNEQVTKNGFGPQSDFLWLTADEKKAFLPSQVAMNFEYHLPDDLLKRIARFNLLDRTLKGAGEPAWPVEHFRGGELKFRVIDVTGNDCLVRMTGAVVLADNEDEKKAQRVGGFHLYGRMVYQHKTGSIQRFELGAAGAYVHGHVEDWAARIGVPKSLGLGIVFELAQPGSLGYGTIPCSLYGSCRDGQLNVPIIQNYFGINPYAKMP
jgi:hypothetical protein